MEPTAYYWVLSIFVSGVRLKKTVASFDLRNAAGGVLASVGGFDFQKNLAKGGWYIMTFSEFVGICTIISAAITVITFVLHIYDRKRKWAVCTRDDSLTVEIVNPTFYWCFICGNRLGFPHFYYIHLVYTCQVFFQKK